MVVDREVVERVERDPFERDDDARRDETGGFFDVDERFVRLGAGLRGVMGDLQSLTSPLHSSQADHVTLRGVRDLPHLLKPTLGQWSTDLLK